ncbi:hypothetical protein LCGC14_2249170 [marine sediment metagenome]|uniref:Uncharacterized protein n=1 Tax=marine sediment metagenome TaxID=412755 RepID=A0A0F9D3E4_9ZZZZ
MSKKCEICESDLQWILNDAYHPNVKYEVCSNCIVLLVNCSLTKKFWKKLIANGHSDNEFLLHGDLYDDEGNALQPSF